VHPVFGHLLGSAVLELWDRLGRPEPFRIAEVGAGDGTLARELLDALAPIRPAYAAVDRSPGALAALGAIGGIEVARELAGEPHVVLANELLDNLPFRRFRGGSEVFVDLEAGRLVERCDGDPDADETVVFEDALAFVDRVAEVLVEGYALLIDYGELGGPGGPTHGYREQRWVDDVLADPGAADVTTGVDFAVLGERARERGLDVLGVITQREALLALGLEAWIRDELETQRRLLSESRGLEAVRRWSGRSRATLLADPNALGRLRWMLLGTPGLPAPSWLAP
jgi:NADH dehydrogenase [ubiquinone] 1 alpha subcomplex assembly factor 7